MRCLQRGTAPLDDAIDVIARQSRGRYMHRLFAVATPDGYVDVGLVAETSAKSPTGTRTIGAPPPWRTAATPVSNCPTSHSPCCASSTTAGKPSRASVSLTIG